jgi:uncharacterized membrane-anchored protein YitT (DUF2179 family)
MNRLKSKTKQTWTDIREYVFIAFGLFLYAGAWKAFLLPHQITGGGVTGIGALTYYATGIPISVTYFSINAVLLLISIRTVGLKFSLRTIYGVAIMTFFFSILPQAVPGSDVTFHEFALRMLLENKGNKKPKTVILVVDDGDEVKASKSLKFRLDPGKARL